MARTTKPLSGAAKDAYLKRAISAESEIAPELRARLTDRLKGDIASLSLRPLAEEAALAAVDSATRLEADTGAAPTAEPRVDPGADPGATATTPPLAAGADFDPYTPNVIVVLRTRGRHVALEQLARIENVADLRLLAREQQLGIAPELAGPDEIRSAIVAAAERRIANRRAAAS